MADTAKKRSLLLFLENTDLKYIFVIWAGSTQYSNILIITSEAESLFNGGDLALPL